jgi:hypothetical protein
MLVLTKEDAMTRLDGNIGRFDAISRRVLGACAVLGGLVSLEGFFQYMMFLTWVILAAMIALGFFYITGGLRGGSAVFGLLLIALSLLDGWLALHHEGAWALLAGVVVAAYGFLTTEIGWCPINSLLGKDTHSVDQEWAIPHLVH